MPGDLRCRTRGARGRRDVDRRRQDRCLLRPAPGPVAFFRRPTFDEGAETIGHLASQASASVRDANLVAQERDARATADRARRHFEILAAHSTTMMRAAANAIDATVASFRCLPTASSCPLLIS